MPNKNNDGAKNWRIAWAGMSSDVKRRNPALQELLSGGGKNVTGKTRLVGSKTLSKKRGESTGEVAFRCHLRYAGIRGWVQEYRFHPTRAWSLDFAWPDIQFGVEIDGGVYVGGAHTRGKGATNDREKRAEAQILGWQILVVTTEHVETGQAISWAETLLAAREASCS